MSKNTDALIERPTKGKPWAKYPDCFGPLSIRELCEIARKNGMYIIEAYKPNMHVYNEICLFGTASQMKATQAAWIGAGHKMKPRNFKGIFGVERCFDTPFEKWVEHKLTPPTSPPSAILEET